MLSTFAEICDVVINGRPSRHGDGGAAFLAGKAEALKELVMRRKGRIRVGDQYYEFTVKPVKKGQAK